MDAGRHSFSVALYLALASTSACDNAESTSDAGAPHQARSEPTAPSPPRDSPVPPAPPAQSIPGCANQLLNFTTFPVHGSVRGTKVDGTVCDNGLGTFFLGPEDSGLTPYDQDFFTTTASSGAVPDASGAGGAYGFVLAGPADAVSAELSGFAGVQAAAAGTYGSTTNCGWFDFEVTLPIPPGVVCNARYSPCDPGCEGVGEAFICEPARAKLKYRGRSAAICQAQQEPAQGDWQLTITSVTPLDSPDGYQHFQTHGELTATLVNQGDASDSVVLDLDF